MAHTKKYILENYECEGQLSIDDYPFKDENVDNFVTDVDKRIDWDKLSNDCFITLREILDKHFDLKEI